MTTRNCRRVRLPHQSQKAALRQSVTGRPGTQLDGHCECFARPAPWHATRWSLRLTHGRCGCFGVPNQRDGHCFRGTPWHAAGVVAAVAPGTPSRAVHTLMCSSGDAPIAGPATAPDTPKPGAPGVPPSPVCAADSQARTSVCNCDVRVTSPGTASSSLGPTRPVLGPAHATASRHGTTVGSGNLPSSSTYASPTGADAGRSIGTRELETASSSASKSMASSEASPPPPRCC